ncbi:hypothetical protein WISP_96048 [Willisornis vidua]|uniref:VWFD domain-containing protein n=1 Tax=Willisornis vidua TaxID=1566151 RepID=A0ABQ9D016_9PASS|nr:hypothetical protein WISP_96048 [Willisornis vidua]
MCTAYGDRHYRTFDGLTFDFVGTCKVYLVKGTSSTSLSVIIENIDCFSTGIICRKNIFINVGKSFLVFDDETGNPNLSSYIDDLQKMQLWKAGFFTVVHFPDEHITILWDQRTTVHVQMGHQWQGELSGLCGNFDLKTVNELRTPDNFELTNSQEFGNSWTAVECVDSSDVRNPCSLNPLREPFAKKECGILLSGAFEACHPVVDVTWFYSNCLTDTCGCNQGGDCECFCTSVSAYAHQCCQHGVVVDWRSPRICPYDCEYFNKALGKGPYKLVSYLDGKFVMAAKLMDGVVFPVREDTLPGHVVSFMLTSGLYKPKAHDSNLISFETAERPNYFLQLVSNNTLGISKWKKTEEFHNRSTFVIHKNTWLSGYSSFESFAKPGYFIHISASSVELLKYHHSEEFRLSTLFKLVGIEPADDSPPLSPSVQTPAVPPLTSGASLAVIGEALTSLPVPEAKDRETTLATKLQLTATTGKTEFSAVTSNATLPTITLSSNISSQSAAMTSGRSTTAIPGTTKSNVSLFASVDIYPLFPSTVSSETSTKIQLISTGSTKLLRATEPQTLTATQAVTTSTESESKPISTSVFTGTSLRTTEMPVKTKIMEISEIATRILPTKEGQVKPEGVTRFTPSSFESITEKTSPYVPQFSTSPPLYVPSSIPPTNLTGASEGTKISIEQPSSTVANVTVTSFSPILTTSLLKPASSAPTKAAAVLTKQSIKTTFSPTSMPPISLGKTTIEHPSVMIQHLTGTPEVPLATTLGPKKTTLKTQESLSSETTLLSFITHEKEIPETTSHTEHTSSFYFSPYSLHPSSTTEESFTLSTKTRSVSVSTPAASASGELKKTFKTVSTTGYPSYTVLNTTEFLTTLYTKYPVVAKTTRVTPLSVKVTSRITSPLELATKSTLFSGKTSTEYKSTLVSSTVKTSTSAYSGSVTTSAGKTKETTVPFVARERESSQRTSITGSPLILLSGTETTLLTTQADKSQVESITTISTRKSSALTFSPTSSLISLNHSLPSLPSDGKEASLTTLGPMRTSHERVSFYPKITVEKPMLTTEKTSPVMTFSVLFSITEQSSPGTAVSPDKAILRITNATISPSSEFSSQLVTTTKIMTGKEKSSQSPYVVLPVTKSSSTLSTSQYVGDKSVSSPSLMQLTLEGTTTPTYSLETKVISTALKPTAQSITDRVKLIAATAGPSLPPSSVGFLSWQTSSGDKLSVQTTKTMVIPHFSTQKTMELGHQTSEPSLTSQSITLVYQYPAETKSTVELTSLYPLMTSLPESIHSSTLPAPVGPTKVILPTEKYLLLTDSVTQAHVLRTSVLQSAAPTRTTADLIFGTKIPPFIPEVVVTSSSLTATEKESFPSFSTQKAATDLKFTRLTSFTESLDSRQTLEITSPSPGSKSSSSMALLPETTEMSIMMGSGPSTSTSKSDTEKTEVLPKQVMPSATTLSSTFVASTALSTMAHSSTTASGSSVISSAGQNLSIVSATSGKAEAVTEPIMSSVKPTSFSVTSEAKVTFPLDTVESEEPQLATQVQPGLTQGVTVTPETPQTFYSPYFTNTSSVLSAIHSSSESKPFPSIAPSSAGTTQTSKLEISSEMQTPSVSSLLMISDHQNDTTAPSVSSFAYLSTKPLHGLTTSFSDGLATAEAMSRVTALPFMVPQETAALQTCTPITENECIKHICLDGQLIQVNKSENCPYNATQPSCGVLGFATQMNGDKCCPKWECACRCTIFSDLSIVTYDGNYLALFKEASYIVSQTQDETITIHVLDCRMSNSNSTSLCLAMLNLTYVSNQIIINRLSRKITVNSRSAWPTVRKYGYKVEDSGFKYAVETPTKIRIQWFHNTGVMIIEFNSSKEPSTLGLCACTDSSGTPHAVGELWNTSLSGCCMQKCVGIETIIPVEYNCSETHSVECQRFAEVALHVPGDQMCCPQKICKCACETIPKPQCNLGQRLQLDEQFQNSTENICNCVKYKCVRDKVCLSNERGVLLPGQRIVEHSADGICHISYCTNMIDPSTKYYRINTSSVDCAVKCKAVGGYVVPFLEGCCKTCKEDGKFCKKVTVRMTIRKNDCRSNTPAKPVTEVDRKGIINISKIKIETYLGYVPQSLFSDVVGFQKGLEEIRLIFHCFAIAFGCLMSLGFLDNS